MRCYGGVCGSVRCFLLTSPVAYRAVSLAPCAACLLLAMIDVVCRCSWGWSVVAGIVGTGVEGEGFGWSLRLSLGSRRVIFFKSSLSMLTYVTTQMHNICLFLVQVSFVHNFQGVVPLQ